MRVKKHAILISALTSLLALIIAFITRHGYCNSLLSFLSNAMLGVFSSSVATLFVFIYEYHVERDAAISSFCRVVFDIDRILEHIVYVSVPSEGENIDCRYLEMRRQKNIIEEICEKYVDIVSRSQDLYDAFSQIDFFSDIPVKEWVKAHNLKWTTDKSMLTNKERKEIKENAKAIYHEAQYSGKHKKRVEQEIFIPLNKMILDISDYALNKFSWYLAGHKEHEKKVVDAVLVLQDKIKKPRPWCHAAHKLDSLRYGSKIFWLNEQGDNVAENVE